MLYIFEYDGNGMKKQKERRIDEAYLSSAGALLYPYKLRLDRC